MKQVAKIFFFMFGVVTFIIVAISLVFFPEQSGLPEAPFVVSQDKGSPIDIEDNFVLFEDVGDYNNYLAESESLSNSYGRGFVSGVDSVSMDVSMPMPMAMDSAMSAPNFAEGRTESIDFGTSADRVSDTNVQVLGIDEPDIVKTDGTNIFVSGLYERIKYIREEMNGLAPVPAPESAAMEIMYSPDGDMRMYPQYETVNTTKVITAFPPEDLDIASVIPEGGELLLVDETLLVFDGNMVYGYDVSDASDPKEIWSVKVGDRTSIQRARLYNDTVYLVTSSYIDRHLPCPVPLFEADGVKMELHCAGIYHPVRPTSVDSTYTVSTLNPLTGEVQVGTSFVGSYNMELYMSENAMYVTYTRQGDSMNYVYGFMKENSDIFTDTVVEKIEKLTSYDISDASKMAELEYIFEEFASSLDKDAYLMLENEMENRLADYVESHKRDMKFTEIVKIAIDDFTILAMGQVPGRLLNQFSMDEYKGDLRIAVTVGERDWNFAMGMASDVVEANDVYILDEDLETIGSVVDLGKDEKIYSARFIGDKGYLVTFKQIDPFYILDLSNPKLPEMTGELKIPGYSSYLHPISDDIVLGIGKEGSKVKISLFDVSDMSNPIEADKYIMDEGWSDIANTHHAFLLDKKHEVFFLPGNKGGYVFSYVDNEIKMVKGVSGIRAKRAVYLDDYLYVIGANNIVVLDENTWEREAEIEISSTGGEFYY